MSEIFRVGVLVINRDLIHCIVGLMVQIIHIRAKAHLHHLGHLYIVVVIKDIINRGCMNIINKCRILIVKCNSSLLMMMN